jgi:hypothetical protein
MNGSPEIANEITITITTTGIITTTITTIVIITTTITNRGMITKCSIIARSITTLLINCHK